MLPLREKQGETVLKKEGASFNNEEFWRLVDVDVGNTFEVMMKRKGKE